MIERQPILYQRTEDIAHGIWWLNTQKEYIKKLRITKDIAAVPFYFLLIKEIIFSHRYRKRYNEQEGIDPDGVEDLNFQLIDDIFNRIIPKLGIELSINQTIADKIREFIKNKKRFTVSELSEELGIEPTHIHLFLNSPVNGIQENFDICKMKVKGKKGPDINVYIRKGI